MDGQKNKPSNNASPQYYIGKSLKRSTLDEIKKKDGLYNQMTKTMKLEKVLSGVTAVSASAMTAGAVFQNLPPGYRIAELIGAGYTFALSTVLGIKYLMDKERAAKIY